MNEYLPNVGDVYIGADGGGRKAKVIHVCPNGIIHYVHWHRTYEDIFSLHYLAFREQFMPDEIHEC